MIYRLGVKDGRIQTVEEVDYFNEDGSERSLEDYLGIMARIIEKQEEHGFIFGKGTGGVYASDPADRSIHRWTYYFVESEAMIQALQEAYTFLGIIDWKDLCPNE